MTFSEKNQFTICRLLAYILSTSQCILYYVYVFQRMYEEKVIIDLQVFYKEVQIFNWLM